MTAAAAEEAALRDELKALHAKVAAVSARISAAGAWQERLSRPPPTHPHAATLNAATQGRPALAPPRPPLGLPSAPRRRFARPPERCGPNAPPALLHPQRSTRIAQPALLHPQRSTRIAPPSGWRGASQTRAAGGSGRTADGAGPAAVGAAQEARCRPVELVARTAGFCRVRGSGALTELAAAGEARPQPREATSRPRHAPPKQNLRAAEFWGGYARRSAWEECCGRVLWRSAVAEC